MQVHEAKEHKKNRMRNVKWNFLLIVKALCDGLEM